MSYQDKDMDSMIDAARAAAAIGDEAAYDKNVTGFIQKAFDEVPRIPLFQPTLSMAMQKNVSGYRYWFHRQLDYRTLAKG
jgi:peptide/nickel transport system substrate-binding protein